jgi:hypothetical protein
MIFKSTYEIINNPWGETEDVTVSKIPPVWNNERDISIDDVVVWEQIYHQPGNIGIYVAWSPYTEFYLVAYDLFTKTTAGFKTFSGPDAITEVQQLASELNIELPTTTIRV